MPKFKGKASRNKSPSGPRGGGSTGGYSGCDSLLVPRVAEYARSNDLADVDDVVEHLRGCYREYLRKPMLVFRKGVERAIEEVRKRAPPGRPSRTIESLEAAHLERKGLRVAEDGSDADSDSDSGADSAPTPTPIPTRSTRGWRMVSVQSTSTQTTRRTRKRGAS